MEGPRTDRGQSCRRRREPESTLLHRLVAGHLGPFLAQTRDADGGGLPEFHALGPPDQFELARVLARIRSRTLSMLRRHGLLYHGVLAPGAALRPEIIPRPAAAGPVRPRPGENGTADQRARVDAKEGSSAASIRPRNYTWAELMKRVYAAVLPPGGRTLKEVI